MRKKDDTALFGKVMKLRTEGYSTRDIEKLTGVSFSTVSRWTSKRKLKGKG